MNPWIREEREASKRARKEYDVGRKRTIIRQNGTSFDDGVLRVSQVKRNSSVGRISWWSLSLYENKETCRHDEEEGDETRHYCKVVAETR